MSANFQNPNEVIGGHLVAALLRLRDLETQLHDAKAEIEELKKKLAEPAQLP